MTYKNWIEWQSRIGETSRVYTTTQATAVVNENDHIEHAKFEGDNVKLKIKHSKQKNFEYINLNRGEITTIVYKFNK